MKPIPTPTTKHLFDGPFKIPLPKKPSSIPSTPQLTTTKQQHLTSKSKEVYSRYSSVVYQKLLGKLLQNPECMSKYDMKVLSTHPIIKKLVIATKEGSLSNTSFYVPIEPLLHPQLYASSNIPVIMQTYSPHSTSEADKQNLLDHSSDSET